MLIPIIAAFALGHVPVIPKPYTQSVQLKDGSIEMQTRAQRLVAPGKPDVWLIGAVHIGSKTYYSKLQTLLDAQSAVLFEGVKPNHSVTRPMKPDPKAAQSIYKVLGDAIGLDFQLNDINYDHPNWSDSDLTWGEIQKLNKASGNGKPTQVDMIQKLMDPNSPSVKMFSTLLQSSTPGTREAIKLMIVKNVANGTAPGLDPTTTKIVVDARNKSVMDHFATLVAGQNPPKSVGIFYGALHLPGLQHDLAAAYGYKPAEDQWFTSATANPKKLDPVGQAMIQQFEQVQKNGMPKGLTP